jgi:hypothetical protein
MAKLCQHSADNCEYQFDFVNGRLQEQQNICSQSNNQNKNTMAQPSYVSMQQWRFSFVLEESKRNKMFLFSRTISVKHTSHAMSLLSS